MYCTVIMLLFGLKWFCFLLSLFTLCPGTWWWHGSYLFKEMYPCHLVLFSWFVTFTISKLQVLIRSYFTCHARLIKQKMTIVWARLLSSLSDVFRKTIVRVCGHFEIPNIPTVMYMYRNTCWNIAKYFWRANFNWL